MFTHLYSFIFILILIKPYSYYEEFEPNFVKGSVLAVMRTDQTKNDLLVEKGKNNEILQTIYSCRSISDVSWSFDHSFLAMNTIGEKIESEDNLLSGDTIERIVILDQNYKEVMSITNGRRYAWNPAKNQIVIITGEDAKEESADFFICREIFIIDLVTKQKILIPCTAYEVVWSTYDNLIFLDTFKTPDKIWSFDPGKNILQKTTYMGFNFSYDGKYYFIDDLLGGIGFAVLNSKDNKKIESNSILKNTDQNCFGWIESTHCLIVNDWRNKTNYIVNVDSGKSIKMDKTIYVKRGKEIKKALLGEETEKILKSLE